MKKLVKGVAEFRKTITKESKELFAKLALGQKPDALFITCSDSRVAVNVFASTDPGDVFVLRNIGNLVPASSSLDQDQSAQAALEFSLFNLPVVDIVVCGHSECGAIKAIVDRVHFPSSPHLNHWLVHGRNAIEKAKRLFKDPTSLSLVNQVSQANVLLQLEHIASYPFVQKRVQEKSLRLHGWWFDIANADVYCYDTDEKKFSIIDEALSQKILKTLT